MVISPRCLWFVVQLSRFICTQRIREERIFQICVCSFKKLQSVIAPIEMICLLWFLTKLARATICFAFDFRNDNFMMREHIVTFDWYFSRRVGLNSKSRYRMEISNHFSIFVKILRVFSTGLISYKFRSLPLFRILKKIETKYRERFYTSKCMMLCYHLSCMCLTFLKVDRDANCVEKRVTPWLGYAKVCCAVSFWQLRNVHCIN